MANEIPKIMHFIWAGGVKIMPDEALRNVIDWAKANPDFIINIWVDHITDPEVNNKYVEKISELSELMDNSAVTNIKIMDINEEKVCTPEVRYELNHLAPNYGASSDMLRYNILSKKGGAYFDCGDVFPNPRMRLGDIIFSEDEATTDAGKEVFTQNLSEPRLLVHITPHIMHDPSRQKKETEAPGTEAIICTPNHPLMLSLAEKASQAYYKKEWNYKLLQYEYNYDEDTSKSTPSRQSGLMHSSKKFFNSLSKTTEVKKTPRQPFPDVPRSNDKSKLFPSLKSHSRIMALQHPNKTRARTAIKTDHEEKVNISDQTEIAKRRALDTLALTGPGMAINHMRETLGVKKLPQEYLMPHSENKSTDWVSLPPDHALAWAKFRIIPCNFEQAIASAVESINFEIDNMNILNINAHIEQVACAVESYRLSGQFPGVDYENISSLKLQVKDALLKKFTDNDRFQIIGDKLLSRRTLGGLSL